MFYFVICNIMLSIFIRLYSMAICYLYPQNFHFILRDGQLPLSRDVQGSLLVFLAGTIPIHHVLWLSGNKMVLHHILSDFNKGSHIYSPLNSITLHNYWVFSLMYNFGDSIRVSTKHCEMSDFIVIWRVHGIKMNW